MADEPLRYAEMVEDAMRGVVRQALTEAAERGLPGEHHFYIGFLTQAPEVEMPAPLRAQYPDEMTIVLQHQFWNLLVDEHGFSVDLSFGGKRESLYVPFSALTRFVDPSVEFGLQFGKGEGAPSAPEAGGMLSAPERQAEGPAEGEAGSEKPAGEKIVSLDSFRKK